MAELIVGAVAAAGLLLVVQFARRYRTAVLWWQWVLTTLALLYSILAASRADTAPNSRSRVLETGRREDGYRGADVDCLSSR
jgi:hypothetical protein